MSLTDRELWTVIHGMGLGALFLLAFAGGLAGLWSLRPEFMTVGGLRERILRLEIGTAVMAVVVASGQVMPGDAIEIDLPPAPHHPLEPV